MIVKRNRLIESTKSAIRILQSQPNTPTDRQTGQADRQDRQTGKTDRTNRQTDRQTGRQDKQTGQTNRQTGQTNRTDRANRQDKQTNKQTNKQTDRLEDKETNRDADSRGNYKPEKKNSAIVSHIKLLRRTFFSRNSPLKGSSLPF